MNRATTEPTTAPTSGDNLAVKVARTFIARATNLDMRKGVKRDRDALSFVIGAAAGVSAAHPDGDACPDYKRLELLAFMVASRGYKFLEEIVAKEKQS